MLLGRHLYLYVGTPNRGRRCDRQESHRWWEQGSCWCVLPLTAVRVFGLEHGTPLGPDHQKIAKLDRENEVAPPVKVTASVGKVRIPLSCLSKVTHTLVCAIGHPDRSYGEAADTEGTRSKDQREALCHPGLRVRKGYS